MAATGLALATLPATHRFKNKFWDSNHGRIAKLHGKFPYTYDQAKVLYSDNWPALRDALEDEIARLWTDVQQSITTVSLPKDIDDDQRIEAFTQFQAAITQLGNSAGAEVIKSLLERVRKLEEAPKVDTTQEEVLKKDLVTLKVESTWKEKVAAKDLEERERQIQMLKENAASRSRTDEEYAKAMQATESARVQLTFEREKYKNADEEQQRKIRELSDRVNRLVNERDDLKVSYEKQVEKLADSISQMQEKLELSQNTQAGQLTDKLKDMEAQFASEGSKAQSHTMSTIQGMRADLHELSNQVNSLADDRDGQKIADAKNVERLADKICKMQDRLSAEGATGHAMTESALHEMTKHLDKLLNQVQNLTSKYDEMDVSNEERIKQLASSISDMQTSLQVEGSKALEATQSGIRAMMDKLENMTTASNSTTQELRRAHTQNVAIIEAQLQQAIKERDEMQKARYEAQQNHTTEVTTHLEAAQRLFNDQLEQIRAEYSTSYNLLNDAKKSNESHLMVEQEAFRKLSGEMQQEKVKSVTLEKEKTLLEEKYDTSTKKQRELTDQLQSTHLQLSVLRKATDNDQTEIKELREELAAHEVDNTRLRGEVNVQKEQLQNSADRIELHEQDTIRKAKLFRRKTRNAKKRYESQLSEFEDGYNMNLDAERAKIEQAEARLTELQKVFDRTVIEKTNEIQQVREASAVKESQLKERLIDEEVLYSAINQSLAARVNEVQNLNRELDTVKHQLREQTIRKEMALKESIEFEVDLGVTRNDQAELLAAFKDTQNQLTEAVIARDEAQVAEGNAKSSLKVAQSELRRAEALRKGAEKKLADAQGTIRKQNEDTQQGILHKFDSFERFKRDHKAQAAAEWKAQYDKTKAAEKSLAEERELRQTNIQEIGVWKAGYREWYENRQAQVYQKFNDLESEHVYLQDRFQRVVDVAIDLEKINASFAQERSEYREMLEKVMKGSTVAVGLLESDLAHSEKLRMAGVLKLE